MSAADGKVYSTDCLNSKGITMLADILPGKQRSDVLNWLGGGNNPLDEKSKRKAYELYETGIINDIEVGTTKGLQQIHAFIFDGLYDFAGQIREKNISKNDFMFAIAKFLPDILKKIDEKYIEMNIAHPFIEGNGRATRIWLDLILKNNLQVCVGWSKIEKKNYMNAMTESPFDGSDISDLLSKALTSDTENRELIIKGIDYSYYYEEIK